MEHPGREEMDLKEESPQVWTESAAQEQNTAQVISQSSASAWVGFGLVGRVSSCLALIQSLEAQLSFELKYKHFCGDLGLKLQKLSCANRSSDTEL